VYPFCLQVGLVKERTCDGVPWVFPAPTARNVLDVLSPDSDLAAAERDAQERAANERLWQTEWMLYGEYAEQIIDLFKGGNARETVRPAFSASPGTSASPRLRHVTRSPT